MTEYSAIVEHDFPGDCHQEYHLWVCKVFICECDKVVSVIYESNHGDSLDFRHECGAYYKKSIRIPSKSVVGEVLWKERAYCGCGT